MMALTTSTGTAHSGRTTSNDGNTAPRKPCGIFVFSVQDSGLLPRHQDQDTTPVFGIGRLRFTSGNKATASAVCTNNRGRSLAVVAAEVCFLIFMGGGFGIENFDLEQLTMTIKANSTSTTEALLNRVAPLAKNDDHIVSLPLFKLRALLEEASALTTPTYSAPSPAERLGLVTLLESIGDLHRVGRTQDAEYSPIWNCTNEDLLRLGCHIEELQHRLADGVSSIGELIFWATQAEGFEIPAEVLRGAGLLIRELAAAARPLGDLEYLFREGRGAVEGGDDGQA